MPEDPFIASQASHATSNLTGKENDSEPTLVHGGTQKKIENDKSKKQKHSYNDMGIIARRLVYYPRIQRPAKKQNSFWKQKKPQNPIWKWVFKNGTERLKKKKKNPSQREFSGMSFQCREMISPTKAQI